MPLKGLIDLDKEKARLEKELSNMDKELLRVDKKLQNPGFLEKAPDHVVAKEREKQQEFVNKKDALKARLTLLD